MLAAAAFGCDDNWSERVVGWSPDGALVLLRQENLGFDSSVLADPAHDGPLLTLELRALPSGDRVREWIVLSEREHADQRLRGARWTEAEAALKALGVTVDPAAAPLTKPWVVPTVDASVTFVADCDSGTWVRTYAITSTAPGSSPITVPLGTADCAGGRDPSYTAAYVSPGPRWLVVLGSLGGAPVTPLVVPVEALRPTK
jgi:hypothetical protein